MTTRTTSPTRRPVRGRLAAAALLPVGLLAACGTVTTDGEDRASAAGYPVTVETCGRSVEVDAPPRRVVSMHPSLTELLIQLGVGDRVVAQAQDGWGRPTPELADQVDAIPSLSEDSPPERETLLSESPDLVVSGTEYEFSTDQGFAGYDDLEQAGADAYVATAGCVARRSRGTVADTFTDIEELGRVFGAEDRATALVTEAKEELAEVAEIVGDDEPVRAAQVYVEAGKIYALGGAVDVDVLRLGGGRNVFAADDERFADFFAAEVNPEVLADLAPDAFVFSVNDDDHEAETRAFLEKRLGDTPAVREGRLVAVDNTAVQPGTLAAIDGARAVAEALHG